MTRLSFRAFVIQLRNTQFSVFSDVIHFFTRKLAFHWILFSQSHYVVVFASS